MYAHVFFFKQKTAYEMRISDWSSDACSSDLLLSRDRVDDREIALMRGGQLDARIAHDGEIVRSVGQRVAANHHRQIGPAQRPRQFVGEAVIGSCRGIGGDLADERGDRKSTRLKSSH